MPRLLILVALLLALILPAPAWALTYQEIVDATKGMNATEFKVYRDKVVGTKIDWMGWVTISGAHPNTGIPIIGLDYDGDGYGETGIYVPAWVTNKMFVGKRYRVVGFIGDLVYQNGHVSVNLKSPRFPDVKP